MSIDGAELEQLAALARLRLDPTVVENLERDFAEIFRMINQMRAVDAEDIEPLAHPLDLPQRLRSDDQGEPALRESLQESAPEVKDGFYLVPRAVE